jgi:hypothetical protein
MSVAGEQQERAAREAAEHLLSLDEITPPNANWWFAEARSQARAVSLLLAELAALRQRTEQAETGLAMLRRWCEAPQRNRSISITDLRWLLDEHDARSALDAAVHEEGT